MRTSAVFTINSGSGWKARVVGLREIVDALTAPVSGLGHVLSVLSQRPPFTRWPLAPDLYAKRPLATLPTV